MWKVIFRWDRPPRSIRVPIVGGSLPPGTRTCPFVCQSACFVRKHDQGGWRHKSEEVQFRNELPQNWGGDRLIGGVHAAYLWSNLFWLSGITINVQKHKIIKSRINWINMMPEDVHGYLTGTRRGSWGCHDPCHLIISHESESMQQKIFENNLWVLNIGIFGFMIHVMIINDNPSNPHLPGQAGGSVRVLEHVRGTQAPCWSGILVGSLKFRGFQTIYDSCITIFVHVPNHTIII